MPATNFGNVTDGNSFSGGVVASFMCAFGPFAGANGKLQSLTMRLDLPSGSANVQFALYADNAGLPDTGARIAVTNSATLSSGTSDLTINTTTNPTLSSSSNYWIVMNADQTVDFETGGAGNASVKFQYASQTFGTWPSTFPTSAASTASTYTASGTVLGVSVTPSTLPNGDKGAPYSQTLSGANGTGPYTFATTAGTLPTGLSLTTGGILSGTPTATGSFSFTITATDSLSNTGSQAYTVTINPALVIQTTLLPNAISGTAFSWTITATGGTG